MAKKKTQGWLDKFDDELQLGGFVYPVNYVPQKENGGWLNAYDEDVPQAQLGTHMLPIDAMQAGQNMFEILSAPQKSVVAAITGKYQTPSEAMGIENPWGAFAIDAVLDPVNLFTGEGLVKNIGKSIDKKLYPHRAYRAEVPGGNKLSYETNELAKKINAKGDWATGSLDEAFQYVKGHESPGSRKGLITGDDINFTEYKVPFWKKNVTADPDVVALKKLQGDRANSNEFIISKNKILYPRKTTKLKAVPEHLKNDPFYSKYAIPLSTKSSQYESAPFKYVMDQMNAAVKKENGGSVESHMGGLTDQGFDYNGAWGGPSAQNGLTFLEPTSRKLPMGYAPPNRYPSTELATSIGGVGDEPAYLIPSFKGGKRVNDPDAEFRRTGEHLGGPFKTWQEADEWERTVRHPYVEKGQNIPTPFRRWGKDFAMGGSLPGSVGFTYARTGGIPSNGPYAKKTKASAQDGESVKDQMSEASTNMWGYPIEPNFVEAYSKSKKQPATKKQTAKQTAKQKQEAPEEKKPSIDFRSNRGVSQMDETRTRQPIKLDRFTPDPGYIREGYSDPDDWSDNRSIFSDARAKERGEKLWNGIKKVTAVGQFSPEPMSRYTSIALNSLMGAADAYHAYKDKDYTNAQINAIGAVPLPSFGTIKAIRNIPGLTSRQRRSALNAALVAMGIDVFGVGADLTDNFGLEKKQNGGEMKFYQEGLDWKPRNISRDGSVTKDDNGYWNPENWGKPVEIGSNEITMKGLQEMGYNKPLLGISDTGDVQMMYPGEDYTFDGESVTEYPVKKNGGWLEKWK